MRLFVDDVRFPRVENFDMVIRSYTAFRSVIDSLRLAGKTINYISFDHDIGYDDDGYEESGYDCAKYLILQDMKYDILDKDFSFNVHSANPVGKENIEGILDNYLKIRG